MTFTAYLIDRDGVLNHAKDGTPVAGADRWLGRLERSGAPFLIATNHTTSSPAECAAELCRQGFHVTEQQMHTPLSILFHYFRDTPPGRIYARGAPGLLRHLKNSGLILVTHAPVDTVLLGFDQQMSYDALVTAIDAVLNHGARLIALHENRIFKDAAGRVEPGLGAWVRAVEYAAGTRALIVGKPSPYYYQSGLERLGVSAEHTIMISDDPLGDLAGAKTQGLRTVFVRSGMYSSTDVLDQLPRHLQPDIVCDTIAELPL